MIAAKTMRANVVSPPYAASARCVSDLPTRLADMDRAQHQEREARAQIAAQMAQPAWRSDLHHCRRLTMKYLLVAAALLALTAPAAAIQCERKGDFCDPTMGRGTCPAGEVRFQGECWTPNSIKILPPAEYDKPFSGILIEKRARDMNEMGDLCAPNLKANKLLGCSSLIDPFCIIRIAPDDYLKLYAVSVEAVRRHEIAHCHGWPGSHPR